MDEPVNVTEDPSEMSHSHTDADHATSASPFVEEADQNPHDESAEQFMEKRGTMLAQVREEGVKKDDKNMVTLQPMSPLAASATVVNLLLATGPFA